MRLARALAALAAASAAFPHALLAAATDRARDAGVSGIWVLANLSYAGMRAQDHPSAAWRVIAFLFGLPGTIVTFFVVREGGLRAYGVELPRADRVDAGDARFGR